MLSRAQKQETIQELENKISRQKIAFVTDFRGVSVAKAQELRRLLKKTDSEYKVAKKTLFDRAFASQNISFQTKGLKGEIGIAFCYGEETEPAKKLVQFSRENETFKILGAILAGKILDGKQVLALAKLPSREVILSQLFHVLQSPVRRLAMVLGGNMRNLAVVLNKIKNTKVSD